MANHLGTCATVFALTVSALATAPRQTSAQSADLNPMGYVRDDGLSSVVTATVGSEVLQVVLEPGGWAADSLTAGTSTDVASSPFGYLRHDGVDAVVFRATNNHLYELTFNGSEWDSWNLTSTASAPRAAGDPMAYVRGSASVVVYRGSSDNHVHELLLTSSGWTHRDLTALAGGRNTVSNPWGYVRHDGIAAVVYRSSDNHVRELYRQNGIWRHGDPSELAGSFAGGLSVSAVGNPRAYRRSDGINAIVYGCLSNFVCELAGAGASGWTLAILSGAPTNFPASIKGDPFPYVRSDGRNVVYYRGSDDHIHELALEPSGWAAYDVTAATSGRIAYSQPFAYRRSDGYDAIVHRMSLGRVHELAYKNGAWVAGIPYAP